MGCWFCLILAFLIPAFYVGLLYLFDCKGRNRNDNISIKRRFLAVFVACVISMAVTYWTLSSWAFPLKLMGIKVEGLINAFILPAIFTFFAYFGSFMVMYFDGSLLDSFSLNWWKSSFTELAYIRDGIVAPITEELAFRSCSVALIYRCLDWKTTVFLAPLSFSISHFHHAIDLKKQGRNLEQVLLSCAFQAVYTYLFGVYATFLFVRTGHITSTIVVHMICNNMGLPSVDEIGRHNKPTVRILLAFSFLVGILFWIAALLPLTESYLYI